MIQELPSKVDSSSVDLKRGRRPITIFTDYFIVPYSKVLEYSPKIHIPYSLCFTLYHILKDLLPHKLLGSYSSVAPTTEGSLADGKNGKAIPVAGRGGP
jgi:hypothetical protein